MWTLGSEGGLRRRWASLCLSSFGADSGAPLLQLLAKMKELVASLPSRGIKLNPNLDFVAAAEFDQRHGRHEWTWLSAWERRVKGTSESFICEW